MKTYLLTTILTVCLCILAASVAFGQGEQGYIDKAKVPATGAKTSDFAPAGWKIETEAKGDLNGDRLPDAAMIVQEATATDGKSRGRAVIVVTAQSDKTWKKAVVVDEIIQCVDCGGNRGDVGVEIKNGVISISDYSGSSAAYGNQTYRFRFEAATGRFQLVGADFVSGRGPEHINNESNNYLTGVRRTTKMRGTKKDVVSVTHFKTTKAYLDDVDIQALDEAAFKRIDN